MEVVRGSLETRLESDSLAIADEHDLHNSEQRSVGSSRSFEGEGPTDWEPLPRFAMVKTGTAVESFGARMPSQRDLRRAELFVGEGRNHLATVGPMTHDKDPHYVLEYLWSGRGRRI
jgi:hypothetical protein